MTSNNHKQNQGENMNIDQIRAARHELEDAIKASANEAITAFRAKTGLSPRGIYIQMIDITIIGEREKKYIIGNVNADIEL